MTNIDKQSGIYYKPFLRREPVIIRSPDAMQELSEAPELSQRAVYADVRYPARSGCSRLTGSRYSGSSTP